jgi:hypothetical protein
MITIILIDYENVQKHDLRPLLEHDVLIKVFHNENQKFTSDFLNLALQFSKEKFELIKIKGQGKNAADFHIAYFIGKLSKELPDAVFHIISKDTGFKVLADFLTHLQGVPCMVETSISEIGSLRQMIPVAKPPTQVAKRVFPIAKAAPPAVAKPGEDWYAFVMRKLIHSKVQKPKKKKTLQNQIISICKRKIDENDAEAIIQRLVENKIIECKNEAVFYK